MIVADADVLIDALRGRSPGADRVHHLLGTGALATTAVTAFELRSGARSEEGREAVEALLAALTVLPFDEDAARRSAETRLALETSGAPIGMADYLIVGVCLARSAALLTRNRRHFERIPELELAALEG